MTFSGTLHNNRCQALNTIRILSGDRHQSPEGPVEPQSSGDWGHAVSGRPLLPLLLCHPSHMVKPGMKLQNGSTSGGFKHLAHLRLGWDCCCLLLQAILQGRIVALHSLQYEFLTYTPACHSQAAISLLSASPLSRFEFAAEQAPRHSGRSKLCLQVWICSKLICHQLVDRWIWPHGMHLHVALPADKCERIGSNSELTAHVPMLNAKSKQLPILHLRTCRRMHSGTP